MTNDYNNGVADLYEAILKWFREHNYQPLTAHDLVVIAHEVFKEKETK